MGKWEIRTKVRGENDQSRVEVEADTSWSAIELIAAGLDAEKGEIVASVRRLDG